MAKATPKQIEAIKNFGLSPPPTKAACRAVLSFLLESRWRGMDKASLVAYAIATEKKWLGKQVLVYGERGTVDYITCESEVKIKALRRDNTSDESNSSPFRFHVIGENGKKLGLKSVLALELL